MMFGKKRYRPFASLVALCLLSGAGAHAQPVAETASLDQLLATNVFAIATAEVDGGVLKITGTTKGKKKQVTLDGTFSTKSGNDRTFSFELAYLPTDCIGKVAAEGKKILFVVRFCGAEGPVGARGARGAKGKPGADGAIGPLGDKGETGLKGAKGSKGGIGPAGPAGPQGPTGTLRSIAISGDGADIPPNSSTPIIIGPSQTLDLKAGQTLFFAGSTTARTAGGHEIRIALCEAGADFDNPVGPDYPAAFVKPELTYLGYSHAMEVPFNFSGDYGLCIVPADGEGNPNPNTIQVDYVHGWILVTDP